MRHKGQQRTPLEQCLWQALYEHYARTVGVVGEAVNIDPDEAAMALVIVATELAAGMPNRADRHDHYDLIADVCMAASEAMESGTTVGLELAKINKATLI